MARPENAFRFAYETFQEKSDAPDWVVALRRRAIEQFEELGLPTLSHEDWRFTNVAPIRDTDFKKAEGAPSLSAADAKNLALPELGTPNAVLVDGRFAPELFQVSELPEGVVFMGLKEAMTKHADLVQPHLGKHADTETEAFTALNASFVEDGIFVYVPKGKIVEGALSVLCVSTAQDEPIMSHPRVLIVAEENAHVEVIEDYVSLGDGVAFTNVVSEIVVGQNATVRHYVLERENENAYTISTVASHQSRDSNLSSHTALLGGALFRNNVHPTLDGENIMSVLNGFYMTGGSQLHDNSMRVRHAKPHCESRQYYRGLLMDEGRAVFSGRIIVHEGAQKTDAVQTNMNMLLSENAMVETRPQLEIYADDVKCTHGATVGQMDEEAIFYFRARGIDRETAKRLLIHAFANEIVERMEFEPVQEALRRLVADRLPASALELATR